MNGSIVTKVNTIVNLCFALNDSPTTRELTGNKPTAFFEFFGHTDVFNVTIHSEGWADVEPFRTPDKEWTIDLDRLGAEEKLQEVIDVLSTIVEEWGN